MLCFKNDSVFYSIVRRGGYKEEPTAAATVKSLQSCPTLCDPIDGSPLGSSVPGILQAKILEWVAISFSNVRKWKVKVKSFSRVQLLAAPWTAAHHAPPSMGFSRQEYWSGLPLPSPEPTRVIQKTKKKNCWDRLKCKMGMAVGWLRKLGNKGRDKWWKSEETWKVGSEGRKNT